MYLFSIWLNFQTKLIITGLFLILASPAIAGESPPFIQYFLLNKQVERENQTELKLTDTVWYLHQIYDNNDQLIKIELPSNYTIEFLSEGNVKIKADCNRASGTYSQEGSRLSIVIEATTRAMCPPESLSTQYLRELQSAAIFFFQDGNLYIDLVADTGTMMFKADQVDPDLTEDENPEPESNSNYQDTVSFGGGDDLQCRARWAEFLPPDGDRGWGFRRGCSPSCPVNSIKL